MIIGDTESREIGFIFSDEWCLFIILELEWRWGPFTFEKYASKKRGILTSGGLVPRSLPATGLAAIFAYVPLPRQPLAKNVPVLRIIENNKVPSKESNQLGGSLSRMFSTTHVDFSTASEASSPKLLIWAAHFGSGNNHLKVLGEGKSSENRAPQIKSEACTPHCDTEIYLSCNSSSCQG